MSRVTPFHLVDGSPWPLIGSLAGLSLVSSFLGLFHEQGLGTSGILSGMMLILLCYMWWRDVVRESSLLGFHTPAVQVNLLLGMVWFIISEVLFFFGFFWTFFYASLNPVVEIGMVWPPVGIVPLDPVGVPLLNTVVLLGSGFTVTWSHYSLLLGKKGGAKVGLIFTLALGVLFTLLQLLEYMDSSFSMADSIYGSIFFMATGFHGFHVLVGSMFLGVSLGRMVSGQLGTSRHVGYECAIWYWHFVDVVWLFLYVSVYWWGSL
uniref:Cytochrome c oxidase subunit 3 n=1 Tax=Phallusia mammillata TaxID=59560 RepID=A7WL64_9ASCI|nr:cytochrome c oxidase subunit III [Phallusia mammillata]CAL23077.2 cytochrome c oxidase subunit III [Phallusia mammillata]